MAFALQEPEVMATNQYIRRDPYDGDETHSSSLRDYRKSRGVSDGKFYVSNRVRRALGLIGALSGVAFLISELGLFKKMSRKTSKASESPAA